MVKVRIKDYNQLEEMLSKAEQKPRAIVLYGKHEPMEPTCEIVKNTHDSPEVWFVKHPYSCTPAGYFDNQYKCLDEFVSTLEKGKLPSVEIDERGVRDTYKNLTVMLPEKRKIIGKALREGLDEFSKIYNKSNYQGKEKNYVMAPKLLECWDKHLEQYSIEINAEKIKDMCQGLKSAVREVMPEPELARRLRIVSPEISVLALHFSGLGPSDERIKDGQLVELITDDPKWVKNHAKLKGSSKLYAKDDKGKECADSKGAETLYNSVMLEFLYNVKLPEKKMPFEKAWKLQAAGQIWDPEELVLVSENLGFTYPQITRTYLLGRPSLTKKMQVEYAEVLRNFLKNLNN